MKLPFWPPFNGNKIDLGLERVEKLLERIGNPHLKIPNVIHIAGTNGKGSTLAFLRSIIEASGKSVNLYTSPHLVNFNERIKIRGADIDDDFLNKVLKECKNAAEQNPEIPITFFEGTTIAAFLAFSKKPADFTLIETGLGGRLDATNVVNPIASLITPISMDHMDFLGDSLDKIAAEKAGIIKEGIPVFINQQQTSYFANSKFQYGKDWSLKKHSSNWQYKDNFGSLTLPFPNLIGEFQLLNAALAISVIRHLKELSFITQENIKTGITHANWLGRLQKITGKNIWLDGGHNVDAAKNLAAWIESKNQKFNLVIGMIKTKDAENFIKEFARIKNHITTIKPVQIQSHPDSFTEKELAEICQKYGFETSNIHESSNRLICGSLYLVGEVLSNS